MHTVSVYDSEENYGLDDFEPLLKHGETLEAVMSYYEQKGFDVALNQLIAFVKEASASVTAWPMQRFHQISKEVAGCPQNFWFLWDPLLLERPEWQWSLQKSLMER